MLKPLKETKEAVSKVKETLNLIEEKTQKHFRLSVKCRLGDENFTEQSFFNFTDMLIENGVSYLQGYYYSRPLPGEGYLEFLKNNNK